VHRNISALFCLLALAGFGFADNLLVNGDFEQPLEVGWTDTVVGSTGLFSFTRADTLGQPTPGFAASVYKTLASYASLSQTVDVPGVDLTLQFDGKLEIGGGSSTCWPVAAFYIRYRDAAGRVSATPASTCTTSTARGRTAIPAPDRHHVAGRVDAVHAQHRERAGQPARHSAVERGQGHVRFVLVRQRHLRGRLGGSFRR